MSEGTRSLEVKCLLNFNASSPFTTVYTNSEQIGQRTYFIYKRVIKQLLDFNNCKIIQYDKNIE